MSDPIRVIALGILWAATACGPPAPTGSNGNGGGGGGATVCDSGATQACTCSDGAAGLETCAADGSGYGLCICNTQPGSDCAQADHFLDVSQAPDRAKMA